MYILDFQAHTAHVWQIWRIFCDRNRADEFSRNKLAVERRINARGGGCERTWYGATRACAVGDSVGQSELCDDTNCSVCHIIKVYVVIRASYILCSHKSYRRAGRSRFIPLASRQRQNPTIRDPGSALIQPLRLQIHTLKETPH